MFKQETIINSMTIRREILAIGEIYHIFNRSIANTDILTKRREISRALALINYYRYPQRIKFSQFKDLTADSKDNYLYQILKSKPLVEIFAYALMPNHYHLLLRQTDANGIVKFASNFQNSFAKYFNKKNDRDGSLFKKPFKAKRITSDEVLLHISRYIHLNPISSYLAEYENHTAYPWTSYLDYLGKRKQDFVSTSLLLKLSGSVASYENFVQNQQDYQRKLHAIKQFLLE